MDKRPGSNLNGEGDALDRRIEEQRTRAELDSGKAWLQEQWAAWKKTAEERERSIQELKAWIDQLEAGKAWLEKDRQYWKGVAEESKVGIYGLALRAVRRLFPPVKKEARSDVAASMDGGSWFPKNWPLQPVSRQWDDHRDTPVDRYYVENFLDKHSADVKGCVLEIGDNIYTLRYGGARVDRSEVLNLIEGNPLTTIVADLTDADHISPNQFDCIILTQTLHFIYDMRAALNTLLQILKPGGVLLATFPGISHSRMDEWPTPRYWSLTSHAAKRLFEEVFQHSNVVVEAYGNVLSTSAFLYGFCGDELRQEELEYRDPEYDFLITVRAQKDQAAGAGGHDLKSPQETDGCEADTSGRSAEQRALILLYHRISPPGSDPWSLCVSPERFEAHLQAIREWGTPLQLDDLVARISTRTLPLRAVAVTFDDGYADTLSKVRSLLAKYEVPATMFLPTAALAQAREFWWDELERVFLQPGGLPPTLELEINKQRFRWELGDAALYTREAFEHNLSWRTGQPPPGPRHQLYIELWEMLHTSSARVIKEVLDKILEWAGSPPDARPTHRVLTWKEVADLKDDPWLEFGSHGLTHSSLAALPVVVQARELRQSKTSLEAVVDRRITSLSYPYGGSQDYSILTVALAREAGYKMALINSPGIVDRKSDLFYLPRCYVEDWGKAEFTKKLFQWMEE